MHPLLQIGHAAVNLAVASLHVLGKLHGRGDEAQVMANINNAMGLASVGHFRSVKDLQVSSVRMHAILCACMQLCVHACSSACMHANPAPSVPAETMQPQPDVHCHMHFLGAWRLGHAVNAYALAEQLIMSAHTWLTNLGLRSSCKYQLAYNLQAEYFHTLL